MTNLLITKIVSATTFGYYGDGTDGTYTYTESFGRRSEFFDLVLQDQIEVQEWTHISIGTSTQSRIGSKR